MIIVVTDSLYTALHDDLTPEQQEIVEKAKGMSVRGITRLTHEFLRLIKNKGDTTDKRGMDTMDDMVYLEEIIDHAKELQMGN